MSEEAPVRRRKAAGGGGLVEAGGGRASTLGQGGRCPGRPCAGGLRGGRGRLGGGRLVTGGPLGPEIGAFGALDGEQPDRADNALVVGVPPPILVPGEEHLEAHDPGAKPLEGGKGTHGAGPPPASVGGGEHLEGLAVPSPQKGEAMVPSPASGEWGRGGGVPAPWPSAPSSRSPSQGQKRLAAGHRGGRTLGRGGKGGRGWHLAAVISFPACPTLVGAPSWPGSRPPPVPGTREGGVP